MLFQILLFYLIVFLTVILCLEVDPERPVIEYYNSKYIIDLKVTMRKRRRNGPHHINVDGILFSGAGDNITCNWQLFEYLSGRYLPTPIQGSHRLCDFLYNEPFLGQMYAKQLPANWTCPFPPGEYHIHNLVIHLENFPFNVPFTWASCIVNTRVNLQVVHTSTKELLLKLRCDVKVTQKPKKLN